jgi:hypothetical protein
VLVTVAFIAESITELWENVQELAKDPTIRFALSPTVDATCPPNIERRRVVVGYAELGRFTPLAKNMIAEARLYCTQEKNCLPNTSSAPLPYAPTTPSCCHPSDHLGRLS